MYTIVPKFPIMMKVDSVAGVCENPSYNQLIYLMSYSLNAFRGGYRIGDSLGSMIGVILGD